MIPLNIILDGDEAWRQIAGEPVLEGEFVGVAGLAGGMASGKPSVSVRIDLPDGTHVIAQTPLALFLTAGEALAARHGDPRS